MTHNIQVTINFKKKYIKKEAQKVRAPIKLSLETATLHQFTMILNTSLTEIEPHSAKTNQSEGETILCA